jgi:excinuclease ABC subunit C
MEPRDADVYGWADGVLVRFEVRGGRMCKWTQRAMGEATARERVAATPALWQPFARRNAELAARLLKVTS